MHEGVILLGVVVVSDNNAVIAVPDVVMANDQVVDTVADAAFTDQQVTVLDPQINAGDEELSTHHAHVLECIMTAAVTGL